MAEVGVMQKFDSGATRSADTHKFDYEGFFNPEVIHAFGEYMHEHRHQRDGSLRDSDNWQQGIPLRAYVKSLVRHTIDLWRMHRGYEVINPDTGKPHTKQELCCAIMFNAMGYLKETLDPAGDNKPWAVIKVAGDGQYSLSYVSYDPSKESPEDVVKRIIAERKLEKLKS